MIHGSKQLLVVKPFFTFLTVALLNVFCLSLCSEFCKMAKKIFIYSSDEVKKMTTMLKSSSSLENDESMD